MSQQQEGIFNEGAQNSNATIGGPVGQDTGQEGAPRPFDDPLFTAGYQAFFIILQIFLYMLVGLRFFILRKVKYKMLSPRGVSDICIGIVTFFMTAFFVTYYVGFAYMRETFRLFARVSRFANMADYPEFEPVMPLLNETFNDFLGNYSHYMISLYFRRMLLLVVVWVVKLAFVSIYYEFRIHLTKACRILVYVVSGITIVSLVLFVGVHCLWMANNYDLDLIFKKYRWSIYLTNEFYIAGVDVATDVMLMIIATLVIRSLKLGKPDIRPALVLISVGILTVIITILRTVSVIAKWDLPSRVFVIVEAYVAVYGACLPALRVMTRRWRNEPNNHYSPKTFNNFGSFSSSDKNSPNLNTGLV